MRRVGSERGWAEGRWRFLVQRPAWGFFSERRAGVSIWPSEGELAMRGSSNPQFVWSRQARWAGSMQQAAPRRKKRRPVGVLVFSIVCSCRTGVVSHFPLPRSFPVSLSLPPLGCSCPLALQTKPHRGAPAVPIATPGSNQKTHQTRQEQAGQEVLYVQGSTGTYRGKLQEATLAHFLWHCASSPNAWLALASLQLSYLHQLILRVRVSYSSCSARRYFLSHAGPLSLSVHLDPYLSDHTTYRGGSSLTQATPDDRLTRAAAAACVRFNVSWLFRNAQPASSLEHAALVDVADPVGLAKLGASGMLNCPISRSLRSDAGQFPSFPTARRTLHFCI